MLNIILKSCHISDVPWYIAKKILGSMYACDCDKIIVSFWTNEIVEKANFASLGGGDKWKAKAKCST